MSTEDKYDATKQTQAKTMRAKMKVESVLRMDTCEQLKLRCVCKSGQYPVDGSDEDNTFAKFSPSGTLELTVANPALLGKFNPGDTYYLDFTLVTKPLTVDQMVDEIKRLVEFGDEVPGPTGHGEHIQSDTFCVIDDWKQVATTLCKWVCDNKPLHDVAGVRVFRWPISKECNPNNSKIWARIYVK